jgi:hypothetical protein
MILFKNKYNLILLLAFVLLAITSCHKGEEPVPKFDNVGSASEDVVAPVFKDGAIDEEDSDGDGDGGGEVVGGDDGEDDDGGGAVIGGDDGEDDDGGETRSGGKNVG